jgi:hypothetical protein
MIIDMDRKDDEIPPLASNKQAGIRFGWSNTLFAHPGNKFFVETARRLFGTIKRLVEQ